VAEPVFELRDVEARYGDIVALRGVSMRLDAGATTAIIGANGAGKSTTLNVIAGLHRAAAGELVWGGERCPAKARSVIRDGIAYSPEGRRVFPYMTVADNLRVGGFGVPRKRELESRIESVYERFPVLHEKREQHAGTLSGGQQQMLAIGRALMREPTLLLLDEPTLGLSPKMVLEVAEMIRRIGEGGTTIALVEQNANIALQLAEYAYVLEAGRVALEGRADDLREDDKVHATYLAAAASA
jgi:branched-chain amino acid transport system ATP-binding protein